MNNPNTQEKSAHLLTKHETLKYLNISQSSLYRLETQDKSFPKPIKLVGAIRYQQKAIDQWLDAQAKAAMAGGE